MGKPPESHLSVTFTRNKLRESVISCAARANEKTTAKFVQRTTPINSFRAGSEFNSIEPSSPSLGFIVVDWFGYIGGIEHRRYIGRRTKGK